MSPTFIVDTGPLVALLNKKDQYHIWAKTTLNQLPFPFFTCEAVLTEACFLVRHLPHGPYNVTELLTRNILKVPFRIESESQRLSFLLKKYADVPISLADACLIRMYDVMESPTIVTTDSDFHIYRSQDKQPITTIMPE